MGKETESKLRARMEQWQAYVETGFVEEELVNDLAIPVPEPPAVTIYDAAQMVGKVYETELYAPDSQYFPQEVNGEIHGETAGSFARTQTIEYQEPRRPGPTVGRVVQAVVYDEPGNSIPRPGSKRSFDERNVPAATRRKRFFSRIEIKPERRADLYLAAWVSLALALIVACVFVEIHLTK